MISWDMYQRPTIEEILQHPWMKKQQLPTKEEMIEEYKKRLLSIQKLKVIKYSQKKQDEENKRKLEKMKNTENVITNIYKSGEFESKIEFDNYDENQLTNDLDLSYGFYLSNYNNVQTTNNCRFSIEGIELSNLVNKLILFFESSPQNKRIKLIKIDLGEDEFNNFDRSIYHLRVIYKHDKEIQDLIINNEIKISELTIKVEIRNIHNPINLNSDESNERNENMNKIGINTNCVNCEFFYCGGDIREYYEIFSDCTAYFEE